MSSSKARAEKEREKVVQEKVQAILGGMLKDEDNKYCVDCDSKGPRWASWNLGIFLCIRCAGIHRNLGVHISRVKSVNLDSWTPQQVASMQMMGNSKARAIYEANLPNDYRRPQNDQAVEAFIRQKYEKKKYIAAEWVPSKPPDFPLGWDEAGTGNQVDKKPEFKKLTVPTSKPAAAPSPEPVKTSQPAPVKPVKQVQQQVTSSVTRSASSSLASDLLGLEISSSSSLAAPAPAVSNVPTSSSAQDLLGLNSEFSDFVSATPVVSSSSSATTSLPSAVSDNKPTDNSVTDGKMSKDSIMALFGPKSSPAPANTFSASPLPTQFGSVPQQQQFGGLQQQQFASPQQQQQQQGMFGQFQSPSMFPPQQQQQQHNFLSGGNLGQSQTPAFNQTMNGATQQNNILNFDLFNNKPAQINNNQAANNPFLDTNQLNLGNLASTPSLWQ